MPFVLSQPDVFSCTLELGRWVALGRGTGRVVSSLTSSVIRLVEDCRAAGAAFGFAV